LFVFGKIELFLIIKTTLKLNDKMAKVSKILKFKSKNGEPVPIYIKTIDGKNIYKTPFQLPDELGKYIQDFIRPSTSGYLQFGKGIYKRLYFRMWSKNNYLSISDKAKLHKKMVYIMGNYEKWLASRKTPLHKKWLALRNDPLCKRDVLEKAKIETNKELKDVYGFDLHNLGL